MSDVWYVHYISATGEILGMSTGADDWSDTSGSASAEINPADYPERRTHYTFDGTAFVEKSQADKDAVEAARWARNRRQAYPEIAEQLDKLYHDINSGTLTTSGQFYTALNTVKTDYPKPSGD